jgi:hypothetical protein
MKIFLCALLLLFSPLHSDVPFKKRFQEAEPGSYVVFEQGKTLSLLNIHSRKDHWIIVEEISLPANLKIHDWQNWMRQKAPGHTSWTMYKIDLDSGELLECFSFSRASWIQVSGHNFLSLLLKTSFTSVPPNNRKKIGPPPLDGADLRALWNPPFFWQGKKLPSIEYDVVEVEWPRDSSELSQKKMEVYFDKAKLTPFPTWIQIQGSHMQFFGRAVDAGSHLTSYYPIFPSN